MIDCGAKQDLCNIVDLLVEWLRCGWVCHVEVLQGWLRLDVARRGEVGPDKVRQVKVWALPLCGQAQVWSDGARYCSARLGKVRVGQGKVRDERLRFSKAHQDTVGLGKIGLDMVRSGVVLV